MDEFPAHVPSIEHPLARPQAARILKVRHDCAIVAIDILDRAAGGEDLLLLLLVKRVFALHDYPVASEDEG